MENVIIYHNPRCSKSRQALELLQSKGFKPTVIEYLKTPPDTKQLKAILKLLGIRPRELLRKNEEPYKELNLAANDTSDEELIAAMVSNPILIERPIVIINEKAVIARPPERLLEIA